MNPEPLISYAHGWYTPLPAFHYIPAEKVYGLHFSREDHPNTLHITRYHEPVFNLLCGPDWFELDYSYEQTRLARDEKSFKDRHKHYKLIYLVCSRMVLDSDEHLTTAVFFSDCFEIHEDGSFGMHPALEVTLHSDDYVGTSVDRWSHMDYFERSAGTLRLKEDANVLENTCACPNSAAVLTKAAAISLPQAHVISEHGKDRERWYPCYVISSFGANPAQYWHGQTLPWFTPQTVRREHNGLKRIPIQMAWSVQSGFSWKPPSSTALPFRGPMRSDKDIRWAFMSVSTVCFIVFCWALFVAENKEEQGKLYTSFRRPRPGYSRIHWQCDCGEALHGDYTASHPWALQRFEERLQAIAPIKTNSPSLMQISRNKKPLSKHSPSFLPDALAGEPPSEKSNVELRTSTNNTAVSSSNTGASSISSTGSDFEHANCYCHPVNTQHRRYFELCVNTSSLSISLGELDLNPQDTARPPINTDAQLFKLIHDRYFQIRKSRLSTFLYKPVDIHFVRFSIFDGGHVGIYEKPMSLPPESAVKSGNYHYYECPLDPLPPIDHRTFLHYFWHHKRHEHTTSNIFLRRLPKKMDTSMRGQEHPDLINLGWGVHIIEGPNKKAISLGLFVTVLLSFVVSLSYSLATHATESGFGIGQWIVATLSVGLSAVYFHVSE